KKIYDSKYLKEEKIKQLKEIKHDPFVELAIICLDDVRNKIFIEKKKIKFFFFKNIKIKKDPMKRPTFIEILNKINKISNIVSIEDIVRNNLMKDLEDGINNGIYYPES